MISFIFQVNSQIIRSPLSFFNPRAYTDAIIELPRNIDGPRNFIDIPRNFIDAPRIIEIPRSNEFPRTIIPQPIIAEQPLIPVTNIPPSTTVITDCTPSVCKNLADTINLMVVSNLLQNTLGDLKTLKMAGPLLKNIASNPSLASYPGLISRLVNPNLIAPNLVAPNAVAPRLVAPNPIAPPNAVAPNIPDSAKLSNLLKILGNAV